MTGPTTLAIPYDAPIIPMSKGRFAGVVEKPTIVYAPDPNPAAPTPVMARPTMRALLFGATPQTREPTSKMNMASRKLGFSGKYL